VYRSAAGKAVNGIDLGRKTIDPSKAGRHNIVEIFNNQGSPMPTVNFSVPQDVKDAFNAVFKGQNKSAVITDLMQEAVARALRHLDHRSAVDRILARRTQAPLVTESQFQVAREKNRT
jgi:hypothetical protein